MQTVSAAWALLPVGWQRDVSVTIGADGRIQAVTLGSAAGAAGVLLPAPCNLHSHAFQRAMAGLTERSGPDPKDTFWTWRRAMYRFLDLLTPDQVQVIAELAFLEMLEAGFAAVGEFHYLHHGAGGALYDDPSEMSGRISAAAERVGLGLAHLPVLYMQGGADGRGLAGGQLRFGTSRDGFERLVEGAERHVSNLPPDSSLGLAAHSLRAVGPDALTWAAGLRPEAPFHLHIAEQVAEIEEIRAVHGTTPLAWLLDTQEVDHRWCLVHATHITAEETAGLAKSGAVAGLCPVTEANLGDGVFPGVPYLAEGGRFGIGTDSNIRIGLTEELRCLEYAQRLQHKARAVMTSDGRSTGRTLFAEVLAGGAQAIGRDAGGIATGLWADLVLLDDRDLDLQGLGGEVLLDSFIFAAGDTVVRDVWSAGRHVVRGGRHIARDAVESAYRQNIAELRTMI
ncbi:MAG: formimidoylglutamate deiminase [Pseudomonadota bacterium]